VWGTEHICTFHDSLSLFAGHKLLCTDHLRRLVFVCSGKQRRRHEVCRLRSCSRVSVLVRKSCAGCRAVLTTDVSGQRCAATVQAIEHHASAVFESLSITQNNWQQKNTFKRRYPSLEIQMNVKP
jgi:hypothetical protein